MEKVMTLKYGNLSISQEAIKDLISLAVKEIEGVILIEADSLNQILNFIKKTPQAGISFDSSNEDLAINLNVTILNGYKISDISFKIQEKVKRALEAMLAIEVSKINIRIVGINND